MTAFFNFHVFVPGTPSRRVSPLAIPRGFQRRSVHFAAAARVAVAVGETLLLLWTVLVLAFSLLVMACFFL